MPPSIDPFTDRAIVKTVHVDAPRAEAWRAWTDEATLTQWFSPEAKIELRPGGAYEMYFLLDQPPGGRGGEGNTIQSYLPGRLLAFTWNAPPSFGPLRGPHTYVLLEFADRLTGGTEVKLTHYGWREGDDWAKVYDYFDAAWTRVLASLAQHLKTG